MDSLDYTFRYAERDIAPLVTGLGAPNLDDAGHISEQLTHLVGGETPEFGYLGNGIVLFEGG